MKINWAAVFRWILQIASGLVVLSAIMIMCMTGYAERNLGVVRVPRSQWSAYVARYAQTYQLRSIIKVAKYNSITYAFRNQEPPFNNLDLIYISANVAEADALMFAPKGIEVEPQQNTFVYRDKKYPACSYTWMTKSLTEQQAALVIAATELNKKRYYLKSFRTRDSQAYAQEFPRFLDALEIKQ
jgi:hypothetical protein